MNFAEWVSGARDATLPPLSSPPPVPLLAHQTAGARRLLAILRDLGGALLLDEVGMGKSFTAAAVMRERQRQGVQLELVVPRALVTPWSSTLARFGISATVLTHDAIRRAPSSGNAERLLVVDEAHRFRTPGTRRHLCLGRSAIGASVLLITATPVWNTLRDLQSLLRIVLADDALASRGVPSIELAFASGNHAAIRAILAVSSIRRSAERELEAFPGVSRRVVRFEPDPESAGIANAIRKLRFPLMAGRGEAALMSQHLWRRYESSPEALSESLGRQMRFCRRAKEKLASGFRLGRREFASLFEREEREFFQDLLFPEVFLPAETESPSLHAELEAEIRRLDDLTRRVAGGPSMKLSALTGVFRDGCPLPAIIFTRAIATAERVRVSLSTLFRTGLASSQRVIDDSGTEIDLQLLLRRFRARQLDVLVLTDLASEGLDLQASAAIIHYDLPWTAVKLDQRTGRARRIGQVRATVESLHFIPRASPWRNPLRYLGEKRRLADVVLVADPFPAARADGPPVTPEVLVCAMHARVEQGLVTLWRSGTAPLTDLSFLAGLAEDDVEDAREAGRVEVARDCLLWKTAAAQMPARIPAGSALGTVLRASRGVGRDLAPLAFRRFRMGEEELIIEAIRNRDFTSIDRLLLGSRALTQRE